MAVTNSKVAGNERSNSVTETILSGVEQGVEMVIEYVAYEEGVEPYVVFDEIVPWEENERQIVLVKGDVETSGIKPYSYDSVGQRPIGQTLHSRSLYNEEMACGSFLNIAEQNGLDEQDVLSELVQYDWCFEVIQKLENRTQERRFEEVLRQVEEEDSEYREVIFENGSQREVAHNVTPTMRPPDSDSCYGVALWVALHQSEAEYMEGFATTKYGGIRNHAWVEIDGKVMDYTWNWTGVVPPENCVYYGCKPDFDRVKKCYEHRVAPPFIQYQLSDEEVGSSQSYRNK